MYYLIIAVGFIVFISLIIMFIIAIPLIKAIIEKLKNK